MDADAAKRAAAAEARRQKILARGADRLNRITVGTPLPVAEAVTTSAPADPATAASDRAIEGSPAGPSGADAHDAADAVAPTTADTGATISGEATAAEETSVPAAVLASADPMLQEVLRGSSGQPGQDTAAVQAAQRDAEQALHMLLNQLAGTGGTPFFVQPPGPSGGGGDGDGSEGSSGRGAGMGDSAGAAGSLTATAATAAGRRSPSAPRAAPTAAAAGGAGSRLLVALVAAVAAVAGVLLGPHLTAAVEATRRLRCVAAVALAALLYFGVVEPPHLQLPPVVALLILQGALIAAARVLGGGPIAAALSGGRPALGLSKSASGADLASGNGDDADEASAATAASGGAAAAATPAPPPRFDWATMVPGLRPLLDKMSSAGALVSGLFGDVAVFVVSYLVLDAWGQATGRRAMLSAAP